MPSSNLYNGRPIPGLKKLKKKKKKTTRLPLVFFLPFFCTLAASGMPYNRTEHSQSVFWLDKIEVQRKSLYEAKQAGNRH